MARSEEKILNKKDCPICGKRVKYQCDVRRHMKMHDSNRAALEYRCPHPGCEKTSLQKHNLKIHYRNKHTDLKPYVCEDPACDGWATSHPSSMLRHKKNRHGYKPRRKKDRAASPVEIEVAHSPTTGSSTSSSSSPSSTWSYPSPSDIHADLNSFNSPSLLPFAPSSTQSVVFTPSQVSWNSFDAWYGKNFPMNIPSGFPPNLVAGIDSYNPQFQQASSEPPLYLPTFGYSGLDKVNQAWSAWLSTQIDPVLIALSTPSAIPFTY